MNSELHTLEIPARRTTRLYVASGFFHEELICFDDSQYPTYGDYSAFQLKDFLL